MSSTDVIGSQIGNLGVAIKGLLLSRNDLDLSAGMSMNVPTGPGVNYFLTGLPPPGPASITAFGITVQNQSVHLLPFVGALWRPSDRLFVQGYIQVDVDASGDAVLVGLPPYGTISLGRIYDPTLLYINFAAGYWLRKGDCCRLVSGLALIGEIHVNESVGSGSQTNLVPGLGTTPTSFSLVDMDFGLHLDMGQHNNVTCAYVAPLSGGPDRALDGGFRLFYNYTF